MNPSQTENPQFQSLSTRAFLVGGVALAASAAGALAQPDQFFHSYLLGYVFFAGLAAGCMAVMLLHNLVGGGWGVVIRRPLESGTRTLPLMLVMILPVVLGMQHIYHWAIPDEVAADSILQFKSPYLNVPFFVIRSVVYFAIWIAVGFIAMKRAAHKEQNPDDSGSSLRSISGPGLVLFGFSISFAAIDWLMSLEAHWFSTMYGITFMVGNALCALALVVVVVMMLSKFEPLASYLTEQHSHDLGNLLLAFVMLWSYVAISQFIIIWSGDLPEETTYYVTRFAGVYGAIALVLVVFHFCLPFLLLLSRQRKRKIHVLGKLALWIVVIRFVDTYWLVAPAFDKGGFQFHWMDLVAPIGVGGIWLGLFLRNLSSKSLLPADAKPAQGAHA